MEKKRKTPQVSCELIDRAGPWKSYFPGNSPALPAFLLAFSLTAARPVQIANRTCYHSSLSLSQRLRASWREGGGQETMSRPGGSPLYWLKKTLLTMFMSPGLATSVCSFFFFLMLKNCMFLLISMDFRSLKNKHESSHGSIKRKADFFQWLSFHMFAILKGCFLLFKMVPG